MLIQSRSKRHIIPSPRLNHSLHVVLPGDPEQPGLAEDLAAEVREVLGVGEALLAQELEGALFGDEAFVAAADAEAAGDYKVKVVGMHTTVVDYWVHQTI